VPRFGQGGRNQQAFFFCLIHERMHS
jgi:hypothetical protein